MPIHRILIFGNSGAGKTTMARQLARAYGIPHLDLDQIAWSAPGVRRPLDESRADIRRWIEDHPAWVMEGCYGDLLEMAAPFCTEMRFLNPGVDACVANCRTRPWEPNKYPSKKAQDQMLAILTAWVRDYEIRSDEFSRTRHREIFDRFPGKKLELVHLPAEQLSNPQ